MCFNTQPPKGGWLILLIRKALKQLVSTHSSPKAAGCTQSRFKTYTPCFNTQQPEGGWVTGHICLCCFACFNTQQPEGGWRYPGQVGNSFYSFNTQQPEGGWTNQL